MVIDYTYHSIMVMLWTGLNVSAVPCKGQTRAQMVKHLTLK